MLSIAEDEWRKGAYKCIQSVFLLLALHSVLRTSVTRKLFIYLWSINTFTYTYYTLYFGEIDVGTITSILNSNVQETFEFIINLDLLILFQATITASVGFFLLNLFYKGLDQIKVKKVTFVLPILASYTLSVASYVINSEKDFISSISHSSFKFLSRDVQAKWGVEYLKYNKIMQRYAKNISPKWQSVSGPKKRKDIYIVFIGESARKDAFGLYNSIVSTTPSLIRTKKIQIVTNPISPAVQTRESLIRILSLNNKERVHFDYNIVDLANMAGFETIWLSNQGRIGKNDTTVVSIAERASKKIFLNRGFYHEAGKDDKLLMEFKNLLNGNNSSKSKVIFIHTMGSHFDFCSRIWKKAKFPNTDSRLSCYYNSIHNGFQLIMDSLLLLQEKKLSYEAIYFSDHGLVKSNKSPYLAHGAGKQFSPEAVDVPLIFFSDQIVSKQLIQKNYFLRDFPHTFAHWIGIQAKGIDHTKSILFEDFDEGQEDYVLKSDYKYTEVLK